jgi:hypothetical protein
MRTGTSHDTHIGKHTHTQNTHTQNTHTQNTHTQSTHTYDCHNFTVGAHPSTNHLSMHVYDVEGSRVKTRFQITRCSFAVYDEYRHRHRHMFITFTAPVTVADLSFSRLSSSVLIPNFFINTPAQFDGHVERSLFPQLDSPQTTRH